MSTNSAVVVNAGPFAVELRKTAAESGWDERTQKEILLGYIAHVQYAGLAVMAEFRQYLDAMSRDEMPVAIAFPSAEDVEEDDEEDEEDEDDEEEDEGSDLEDDLDYDDDDDDFDDDLDDDEDEDEDDEEDDEDE